MFTRLNYIRAVALCATVALVAPCATSVVSAQRRDRPDDRSRRHDPWEWSGNYQRLTQINRGTYVTVRTSETIRSDRRDDRVYSAVVLDDVWDDYGRLAVPAIPRGSRVDLVVRTARDGDLILDLESLYAHGQRYAIDAVPERLDAGRNRRDGDDIAAFVGGGAVIGTIIGSIAGGGKGAAIGAATGAAAGAGGLALRGRSIRVPAGSQLTFRLDEDLLMGVVAPRRRR